ncbi:MAG: hypothetical protein M3P96_14065 [Actinomycetota bacterium]|nr:hypothetical protein [Actinomycetota bacterium]
MEAPEVFLKEAVEAAAAGRPVELSVRDLLGHWNQKRRGYVIVAGIQFDLTEHGLTTHPPFTDVWIDAPV